ncbi:YtxH domain-containing protein [Georgenia subflava]|uniref:YtxH domain-containing protein n=1 Tax=Georgenia subflava TaxID=1622177 RepID=UPI00186AC961|nr:YtxH domain-containing protein [Georgenia subflava]
MGKLSFVLGAGLGYVLGARAGRGQYEKIKKASSKVWENPRVQANVQKVETKVTDVAKERGSAVTDKVAATVKEKLSGSGGAHSSDIPAGNTGRGTDGPLEPTPPQPQV